MISEIYLLNASVEKLPHPSISTPQNAITEGRNTLLLARIVCFSSQVILIRGLKIYWSFLKLIKKQLHVLFVSCLFFLHGLTRCFPIRFSQFDMHLGFIFSVVESCERKRILIQKFYKSVLLDFL